MADGEAAQGIGIHPRQRELLGLLLALMAAALLAVAAANARAMGGINRGTGVLTVDVGSTTRLEATLKLFAMNQAPTQVLLLIGALTLVGSGAWDSAGPAARFARVLVLAVGVVVGVSAAYGALLLGPLGEEYLAFGSTAVDGRVASGLLALAISASALVAARLAFGLLPIGVAGASPSEPGEPPTH